MRPFVKGDFVKAKTGHYIGYTAGSPYNIPRGPVVVHSIICTTIIVKYTGASGTIVFSPPLNAGSFEFAYDETECDSNVAPRVAEIEAVVERIAGIYREAIKKAINEVKINGSFL